ncbi:MAG: hypothetical protein COS42_02635 [Flavobacteriales bacterium CG03_land_8_20_14_0_80_35_15]|nr:hypothetical protein [Zetaproteobacteria bacterium]NDK19163.1 hypothetical protein [Flavobacteriales bacterium]OIO09423.1 MAG: hypothetical protein AUJ53_09415 [Flavobacteriaceae bacterium CG1_02_35_72]PIV18101.1 MAG: hypothetical protein COS42_02635 [Flavobacteriales bacterium CG03_land_8_20_14_0_80_35_15]PIX07831.1 MAG: hypothetical protein COZ76_01365 [Flavobacteriales bacterium CG_4_8_14_3_um_filter_35_10]PJA05395.1 MAG: hypothetical protein COX71_06940 [Flavobacteriales bacterium CG_4_
MELNNIEKLLDKYFEGATSLNEEAIIRQYFTTQKVPAHLEAYQDLFGYYAFKNAEESNKPIVLNKKFKVPYKWLSIAAMFVVVLGSYLYKNQVDKTKQAQLLKDYQTTQQALELISNNLNKSTFAFAQLQEFENTTNKIFKENE